MKSRPSLDSPAEKAGLFREDRDFKDKTKAFPIFHGTCKFRWDVLITLGPSSKCLDSLRIVDSFGTPDFRWDPLNITSTRLWQRDACAIQVLYKYDTSTIRAWR